MELEHRHDKNLLTKNKNKMRNKRLLFNEASKSDNAGFGNFLIIKHNDPKTYQLARQQKTEDISCLIFSFLNDLLIFDL